MTQQKTLLKPVKLHTIATQTVWTEESWSEALEYVARTTHTEDAIVMYEAVFPRGSTRRRRRTSARGAAHDHRQQSELRHELYEAHRLIDGLHRRFPETLPARRRLQLLAASSPR
jgi:hypothetical protein